HTTASSIAAEHMDVTPGYSDYARSGRPVSPWLAQYVLEILQQIIDVLDADGQPDEAVADPHAVPHFLRHGGVRHDRGVSDQRLHAAEGLRQREDARALHYLLCAFQRAQLDADHAREPPHLTLRQGVLRVLRQAGIEDLLHGIVVGQEAGHLHAVAVMR